MSSNAHKIHEKMAGMEPTNHLLQSLQPEHSFLVAVDSDGCAFDAMGIKQSECFCPMMIGYFELQPVARAARECKIFADLFSRTRGANRHKTIVRILMELLPSHPMVKERNFRVPQYPYYFRWVKHPDSLLSDTGLEKAIVASSNEEEKKELSLALKWSRRVNELIAEIVRNVPPFPYVQESLEKVCMSADIIVCSATPNEALEREWSEHDLRRYVKAVAGQERGSKTQHLKLMREKYDPSKILMLGDAMGDLGATRQNGVSFYPIIPGQEAVSWERFYKEAFEKFLEGTYNGAYEDALIREFENCLPVSPNWQEI
jgi:phosphoglycolate phosphatase-like HAD superfamily hydrolase